MEISNELLAAYAENKVTDSERIQVREYLVEHPEEIESVMIMMDEDYDLSLTSGDVVKCESDSDSQHVLNLKNNVAAFACNMMSKNTTRSVETQPARQGMYNMLGQLLDLLK